MFNFNILREFATTEIICIKKIKEQAKSISDNDMNSRSTEFFI